MEEIGRKIRALRQDKRLALKEVAAKTGLTSSFLSQLEKGTTSPSIESLRKIADVLNTTVGYFFEKEEVKEFVFIKRKKPQQMFSSYEILASSLLDIKMLPMLLRLKENEELAADDCPKGEEILGLPVKGKIGLSVNGKDIDLEFGDSIYLIRPHFQNIRNLSEEESMCLWIAVK